MRYETSCTFLVVVALLAGTAGAFGQSLGDVARKEDVRRKATAPGKVYTNKDLREAPPGTPSSPTAASPPSGTDKPTSAEPAPTDGAKDETSKADKSDKTDKPTESAGGARSQADWADRLKQLQTQLDRDQTFVAALEARVAALNTDFVNRDDPAQRSVVAKDRQKSLEEMTRLKKAIDDDKKAIADLREEARRAGVPPGWLR
jgi:hypothetical protein